MCWWVWWVYSGPVGDVKFGGVIEVSDSLPLLRSLDLGLVSFWDSGWVEGCCFLLAGMCSQVRRRELMLHYNEYAA